MRFAAVLLCMLLGSALPAAAQVSIGIGLPGVSIGFNVPSYPQLVQVPVCSGRQAPSGSANWMQATLHTPTQLPQRVHKPASITSFLRS